MVLLVPWGHGRDDTAYDAQRERWAKGDKNCQRTLFSRSRGQRTYFCLLLLILHQAKCGGVFASLWVTYAILPQMFPKENEPTCGR